MTSKVTHGEGAWKHVVISSHMGKDWWRYSSGSHKCNTVLHFHLNLYWIVFQMLQSKTETIECNLSCSRIIFYIWLYMLLLYLVKGKKRRELNQSRKQKRVMGNRWMMTSKEWHEKLKKCYTKPGNCHFAAMASICDRLQHCFTTSITEGRTDVTMRNSQFE